MRLENLTVEKESQYIKFLLQERDTLVYASTWFRDFLRCAVGGRPNYLLALDDYGNIRGSIGYFEYEAPGFGRVLNSLPWYGSHGGCNVNGADGHIARHLLLEAFCARAEEDDVLSATVILPPEEQSFVQTYRSILNPSSEDTRVGQITLLPQVSFGYEEALEQAIRQKTRNLARKSLKQGFELQVRDDEGAREFLYDTHVENMNAIGGKAKPESHFRALFNTIPRGSRKLLIAINDGEPIAALLLLYFNETVEYFTPVIKHEYRSRQPLSFLIWNGMLDAMRDGFRRWNWGGTWPSQNSLHHFKSGWGAQDFPYTYLIKCSQYGKRVFEDNFENLADIFPYFYTYPYDRLK